ncbi:CG14989 [Drosophila busckii]|uniref:CG14989 n=2 Tax=Drosophila busckii TaxID=30019 RepID=A0A0M4EXI4_DROBS|nr:CG14989 [Drosophila busckii]
MSSSVVQNWSLVCQELCGARLGVAPCAKYCATPAQADATADALATSRLNTVFNLNKCEQLHGKQTDSECNDAIKVDLNESLGDRLCSSYCQQCRRTLSGCSPCQYSDVLSEVSLEQSKASHGSRAAPASAAEYASDADTPDWNELCKSLCKTGDGGSLCNCDLSPFFS